MSDSPVTTIAELQAVIQLDTKFEFTVSDKKGRYQCIGECLKKFRYHSLKTKKEKSTVCAYLRRVTHISKAQLKRLIKKHKRTGRLIPNYDGSKRNGFRKKYGSADIALLIRTDSAHRHLSGEATKKIMQREYEVFHHQEYKTISEISVSHLYSIRNNNRQYTSSSAKWIARTKAAPVNIGIRAKPKPNGRPGFLPIDTVHSGDLGGKKGAYHINIVDEVTQWEMVATVEAISEFFLTLVIEELFSCFPFLIHEFHSDNGSEFINHVTAKLLTKLYIRFTKSRARHSNDNALVESKNGSIIRKLYGRNHIPASWAPTINAFNRQFVNVYLNYHRPCGFADITTDTRGKEKKTYTHWMTPYEKFNSLEKPIQYLKPDISLEHLENIATVKSDNEFAEEMQIAKVEMFKKLRTA